MTTASYAQGLGDRPLLGETIGQCLDRIAGAHPHAEALVDVAAGRRWTYAELRRDVRALALGLLEHGIAKGDRVGIWAPSSAEWTLFQYASAQVGAVLVTLNPAYGRQELQYVLNQSGTRLLVAAAPSGGTDPAALVDDVASGCPMLEEVLVLGTPGWDSLARPHGDGAALAAREASLSADDPINIQYTSGTTGHPKGATLSHHNILNNADQVAAICGYTPQDRICVPVPLYHTFGMVIGKLGALTHGCCVVYPGPAFDARATLAAVAAERCTSLYGVPTMFIAELAAPDFASFDLSTLRTGLMGGSPCPVEVMRQVIDRMGMAEVMIVYGMTETSPVSTQTRADDPVERRVTTVGRPHPHVEVKIVDPSTGVTTPRGVPGELCTRGYSVMLGYWQQPEQTAQAIDAARWMRTGDLATMDGDGYVNITGRIKDMVIRGGENISPREIEEFLHTHPAIRDVQVIGVPDARLGEEVMAWIQVAEGAVAPTVAALHEFAAGRLARYKVPRYVHVVDEYPMTASGKVRKVELRRLAVELLGLQQPAARATA